MHVRNLKFSLALCLPIDTTSFVFENFRILTSHLFILINYRCISLNIHVTRRRPRREQLSRLVRNQSDPPMLLRRDVSRKTRQRVHVTKISTISVLLYDTELNYCNYPSVQLKIAHSKSDDAHRTCDF